MGMARTASLDVASVIADKHKEPWAGTDAQRWSALGQDESKQRIEKLKFNERIRDVDLPGMLSGGRDYATREKQSRSAAQAFESSAWRNSAAMKNEPVMQISSSGPASSRAKRKASAG